jgi:hypothetical protein
MLEENRKLRVSRDRLFAHLFFGGKIEDIDDEIEKNTPVPGIDYPADVLKVDWLSRRQ